MPARQFIQPEGLARPAAYTHVVVTQGGRAVYISGQVSLNASGELVGNADLGLQARQVHENLKVALTSVGATFADVVKMNTYVVNFQPSDRELLAEIRDEFLPKENRPASTLVGVQALARPELLIEIEAIAVID